MLSLRSVLKELITGYMDRQYERRLSSRMVSYSQWITAREQEKAVGGKDWEADSGYALFYSSHGRLAEGARSRIAGYFREHPEIAIVYGDEDVWEQEVRKLPWFKPAWSPDTFRSYYYFGSVVAVRKELIVKYRVNLWGDHPGMEKLFNHADEILPLICQLVTAVGGFMKGCRSIGHISHILFHSAGEELQRSYLRVCPGSCLAKDMHIVEGPVRLSVIIPSRDNPALLMKAVNSVLNQSSGPAFILQDIIIVDNGSTEENRKRIQTYIQNINKKTGVIYLYQPMEFHFSRMCNIGAGAAGGDVYLFLNDDVEFVQEGTLAHMSELVMRPYVGAAGLKLCYPDTRRIQHAGITNLSMGPVHKLQFLSDEEEYDYLRNRVDLNVLAVTGACLMTAKHKFKEAGGFSQELPVAFNDVDLCFRLYELGYANVSANGQWAWHHESVSRGLDESPEKLKRLALERQKLYARHPGLEGVDPYYAEGLERDVLDTRVRPAWVTSLNRPQTGEPEYVQGNMDRWREDRCLLVRIEYCGLDGIQGYSVVLGDNNACYQRKLVLKGSQGCYSLTLTPQYRPDLEENMTDQRNVAMSGFLVKWKLGGLLPGEYQLGILAVNRVSGLKLVNWSNRCINQSGTHI